MKTAIAMGFLFAAATACAETITVSVAGGEDFVSIAPAVATAQDGDTVLVYPGTYTGTENTNIEFLGKMLVVLGAAGDSLPLIDCEDQARAFNVHEGEAAGTSIERFRIVNGNAIELSGVSGGAINVKDSYCQIREVRISNCTSGVGGGIGVFNSTVIIDNVEIVDCCVLMDGGGLDIGGSSTSTVRNVTIEGCSATWGGGMVHAGGTLLLTDSIFKNNYCYEDGGGLKAPGVTFEEFSGCVFEGNAAEEKGGGLYFYSGTSLYLADNIFRGNYAHIAGGGIFIEHVDDVLIDYCLLDANETDASGFGGGVCLRHIPSGTIRNSTITQCYAEPGRGAGISVMMNSNIAVDSCLVAFNLMGGGIGTWEYQSECRVLCSNVFGNGGGNYLGGMSDQTGIAGNISADPLFCDPDTNDFQVADSSPCLPANNECGVLMGAYGEGCTLTSIAPGDGSAESAPRLPRLRVYPNPTRGELRLELLNLGREEPCEGSLGLRIVDLMGRVVFEGAVDASALAAGQASIDLRTQSAKLSSGIYFGRLRDCQDRPHNFRFNLLK